MRKAGVLGDRLEASLPIKLSVRFWIKGRGSKFEELRNLEREEAE